MQTAGLAVVIRAEDGGKEGGTGEKKKSVLWNFDLSGDLCTGQVVSLN